MRQICRWLRACLNSLGCDPERFEIVDGFDAVMVALRSFPPRVCSLQEFYPGIFPQEEEEEVSLLPLNAELMYTPGKKRPFGDNIQSAEQFTALAQAGWAIDERIQK